MKLYDYVLSPDCYTARLMAALTGQKLQLVAVDFHPGAEHLSPGFRQINPAGTLPVLEAGGYILSETSAILHYLVAGRVEWLGSGPMVAEWLARSRHFAASLGGARAHDMLDAPGDVTTLREAGTLWLRILEEALFEASLDGHTFLTGAHPTIADIALFPHVALAPDGGVALDPYPAIRLWMRKIRALPGFIEMPGIHRLHDQSPEPGRDTGGAAA